MTENAFMIASQKAKKSMAKTVQAETSEAAPKSLPQKEKLVNVRVPAELHRRMMEHRLNTNESMNALIVRLLEAELGDNDEGRSSHR